MVTGGNALDTADVYVYAGGGMHNESASPAVIDCVFRANVAQDGGAMWNVGGSPAIRGCRFERNLAWYSAAMANFGGAPEITDCVFEDNVGVDQGGCVGNFGSSPLIVRCAFSRNYSSEMGGAMQNRDDSSPILVDCAFIENWSDEAGAVENRGGSPSLDGCLFIANRASTAGAAMLSDNPAGSRPIVLRNCVFARNVTKWNAAAIDDLDSTMVVFNSIFVENSAASGGSAVVVRQGHTTMRNCIFWGNGDGSVGGEAAQIAASPGGVLDLGFSCVEGWTGALGGPGNIGLDPLFVDSAAGDYHLWPWSPAIDAGTCDGAPERDFEGSLRPEGAGCDMGVYERAAADPPAFQRGDADGDGKVDLGDAVHILGYLFRSAPARLECEKASDIDDGGEIDISDPIRLLFFLFAGGGPPASPYPGCGEDGTPDPLVCWSFTPCG